MASAEGLEPFSDRRVPIQRPTCYRGRSEIRGRLTYGVFVDPAVASCHKRCGDPDDADPIPSPLTPALLSNGMQEEKFERR